MLSAVPGNEPQEAVEVDRDAALTQASELPQESVEKSRLIPRRLRSLCACMCREDVEVALDEEEWVARERSR
jgi:hypothetical protein